MTYDFAILGGGSAGYAAARTAVSLGLRTVVIDGAEELGGLCILRGCMPSKTLIETANRALVVRHGAEFGIDAAFHRVDTAALRERKRALIADFAGYRQGQLQAGKFELIRGHARFGDAHTLVVTKRDGDEVIVKMKAALIATGSTISTPDVPGLREAGCWTSDTVLDAAEIPENFVVLGGGAIALEMAHFLEGIGRRVTVLQRSPHLLTGMDYDIADAVQAGLSTRMEVRTGTKLLRVETAGNRKRVHFSDATGEHVAEAAEILLALGRQPATDTLDLHAANVVHEAGRVRAAATQQTSQPHIFAAGDVCGPLDVVHTAIQQGETAARNAAALLAGREPGEKMDYRLALFGVFTQPQAAQVGLTEIAAAREGRAVLTASYPFNDHGKSMVMGEMHGFVKMIADAATGEILGAAVAGPEATELIHELVVAMHFRATVRDFMTIPHYHPTLSEIWTYPAEEIADQLPA